VLAEIHGRPFLSYLLDHLANAGIRSVVLLTGYLGEMVRIEFGDSYRGLQLAYSQEPSPLGTAGALRLALPLFSSETVLILNGDSFCMADFGDFWAWHCGRGGDATLLLTRVTDTARFGRVHSNSDGRILRFDEKDGTGGPGWINAGAYLLRRRLLRTIPADKEVSLEREIFPAWIGGGLFGYRTDGRFLDIGTPESYASASEFFSFETKL
jgi:NDP-sugar pyrophosphorylase family protein